MGVRRLMSVSVTALLVSGCPAHEAADAGPTPLPPNLCHIPSVPPTLLDGGPACWFPVPDGGELPPLEVISGGPAPVAEAILEWKVMTNGAFASGCTVRLRAPGRLPETMTEANSVGSVEMFCYQSYQLCTVLRNCPSWAITATLPDGGTELLPGAQYTVQTTGGDPLSCALVGSGETCNLIHGSLHGLLTPLRDPIDGTHSLDWSF